MGVTVTHSTRGLWGFWALEDWLRRSRWHKNRHNTALLSETLIPDPSAAMPTQPRDEGDPPREHDSSPITCSPIESKVVTINLSMPAAATVPRQAAVCTEQPRSAGGSGSSSVLRGECEVLPPDSEGHVIDLVKDQLPELQLTEEDKRKNMELLEEAKKASERFLTRRGRRSACSPSELSTGAVSVTGVGASSTFAPHSSSAASRSSSQASHPQAGLSSLLGPQGSRASVDQKVREKPGKPAIPASISEGSVESGLGRDLQAGAQPERKDLPTGAGRKDPEEKGPDSRTPPDSQSPSTRPSSRGSAQRAPCTAVIKTIDAFPPLMRATSWDQTGSSPEDEEALPFISETAGCQDFPPLSTKMQKLAKLREEHKLQRNQSVVGSKLPNLSEAAEQDAEEDTHEKLDALPNISDIMLRKLKLHRAQMGSAPPLTEKEVEVCVATPCVCAFLCTFLQLLAPAQPCLMEVWPRQHAEVHSAHAHPVHGTRQVKVFRQSPSRVPPPQNAFIQLSLAFRNDSYTLETRLRQAERERDLAEENTEVELLGFRSTLQGTAALWQNQEHRESYQHLLETVAVLHRLATRLSSRAEMVGAVRQERRMNKATEVMMQYVENLKRTYEKDHAELMEFKKLANQNSSRGFAASLETEDGVPRSSRSMSLTMGKTLPRRRVSVAVVPKFNLVSIPGQAAVTTRPVLPVLVHPALHPTNVNSTACEAGGVKTHPPVMEQPTQVNPPCGKTVPEPEGRAAVTADLNRPVPPAELCPDTKAKIEEEAYKKGYQEGLRRSKELQELKELKEEEEEDEEEEKEQQEEEEEEEKAEDCREGEKLQDIKSSSRFERTLEVFDWLCPKVFRTKRLLCVILSLFTIMLFAVCIFHCFGDDRNGLGDMSSGAGLGPAKKRSPRTTLSCLHWTPSRGTESRSLNSAITMAIARLLCSLLLGSAVCGQLLQRHNFT
ncbi:protein MRVI1-like, partial [Scleropages formosus]